MRAGTRLPFGVLVRGGWRIALGLHLARLGVWFMARALDTVAERSGPREGVDRHTWLLIQTCAGCMWWTGRIGQLADNPSLIGLRDFRDALDAAGKNALDRGEALRRVMGT